MRERCIVVAATSDRPALERINGGHIAATIAERFRDQGKMFYFYLIVLHGLRARCVKWA